MNRIRTPAPAALKFPRCRNTEPLAPLAASSAVRSLKGASRKGPLPRTADRRKKVTEVLVHVLDGERQSTGTPLWQQRWPYAATLVQKHSQSPPWLQAQLFPNSCGVAASTLSGVRISFTVLASKFPHKPLSFP
ncbi:hypothetical protein EYF80_047718 [Liparis tanakae]|uniref:Uncharacterized protein n=1 Tax=Liparis tanakae TaxID=230148 RepID=A0A4Z2FMT3_9TELE|nr:hypothetical protein EYF80_047718 [Liparis tanakae]